MSGASQSYPQKVRIDEGKQKAAEVQSEAAKTQGGENSPSDAGSMAKVFRLLCTSLYRALFAGSSDLQLAM